LQAVQETVVVGGLPEIMVAGGEQVGAAPEVSNRLVHT
jgi:hypothetical protein